MDRRRIGDNEGRPPGRTRDRPVPPGEQGGICSPAARRLSSSFPASSRLSRDADRARPLARARATEAADGLLGPFPSGLAQRIVEQLGVELGEIELHTFGNGETYCRYYESIRGADIFLVQTGCEPVDQNLMELLLMIQAAKLASAKRITAVIPWFPVRAAGPQGEAARADLGAPRRRHAAAGGRRPRADDGSARRSNPGLLPRSPSTT